MEATNQIKASPTKELFIDMITKDISLEMAIAELVDNSIDGALTSIKRKKAEHLNSFIIKIIVNEDEFSIVDNCGGFDVDAAKEYAFRFGRPSDIKPKENSVGRFGVGMKRSIFKIGEEILVHSKTEDSLFDIKIDVNDWKKDPDDWTFSFQNYNIETHRPFNETVTSITIHKLYPGVQDKFTDPQFITELINVLTSRNEMFINNGLSLDVNGIQIVAQPQKLLFSERIKPAYLEKEINSVQVKVVAGVTENGYPSKAGWYIYCNDRLIVDSDRTTITGWGDGAPKFHPTFARFRGYLYFYSNDPTLLPWNTTKTNVDLENMIFNSVREDLIRVMKPILDFLKRQTSENTSIFNNLFLECKSISASQIKHNQVVVSGDGFKEVFQYPLKEIQVDSKFKTISYTVPISDFEKVSESIGYTTAKDIGEKTFYYYLDMECDED
ncbi:ATP-binding protein [Paenibacillus cellulositrophicus]|uniref:ATP-binding protein n=1 Tax=Paenibacillus cellulositrophicus TaxID=562959 RepID=UPI003D9790FA